MDAYIIQENNLTHTK